MAEGFPPSWPGCKVGLLGGSFDPPHSGHVHITLEALKRFRLDAVWWLVSPGNPMKSRQPAALGRRMAACQAIMVHPRVEITDLERRLDTRYTAETMDALVARYPATSFVWLMGADNLTQFHRWQRWQHIMMTVPIGVLARPGDRLAARLSPAARRFRAARLRAREAPRLGDMRAPAWCFVNVPLRHESSTLLRSQSSWGQRVE